MAPQAFSKQEMLAGGPPFAAWGSVAQRPFGAADVIAQRAGRGRWAAHAERRGEVRSVRLVIGVSYLTHKGFIPQFVLVSTQGGVVYYTLY